MRSRLSISKKTFSAATFELTRRGERMKGWMDRTALERLLVDSESPASSPYAQGKPLPVPATAV